MYQCILYIVSWICVFTTGPSNTILKRYIKKTIHPLEVLSRYRDPQPQVDGN